MDELTEVFFSGTHGGETLSLAAAREVLGRLDRELYDRLFASGERLRSGVAAAIADADLDEWITITGAAPRTVVIVSERPDSGPGLPSKSLVQQELLKRGVLFNGSNFICRAHSDDDLETAIAAYRAAFERLADGLEGDVLELLEGEPIQPAFRPLA
jgi:glutamate-1-semialdehyde 2,1-aminomutase